MVWLWVLAATVIAAILRLWEIGTWSFWIDEAHTFRDATMPLGGEFGFWSQDRAWYPLTFLGLRVLLDGHWISTGEGAVRLPFALFGIATVPLMWWSGRRLFGDATAAFGAWLLALMPWHVYWSQNARGYVFVVLSATIVTASAWRWHESGRHRYLVSALAAVGIGTLFHPSAAVQLLGLLAFVLLHRRELHARSLLLTAVLAIAALALLPIAIREFSPIEGFLIANSQASLAHFAVTTAYYFRPLVLVAAVAGAMLIYRRHGRDRTLLLVCVGFAPFAAWAAVGGSIAQTTARYAICALPVVLWLSAAAVSGIAALAAARHRSVRLAAGFLGLALLADFGVADFHYFAHNHGDRAQWRQACKFVQQRLGDRRYHVLTVNEPTVRYYLQRDHWRDGGVMDQGRQVRALVWWLFDGKHDDQLLHRPGGDHHLEWQLAAARQNDAEFVVMVTVPELQEVDVDGTMWRALRATYRLVLHLPSWAGPKDQSIYVFMPAGS